MKSILIVFFVTSNTPLYLGKSISYGSRLGYSNFCNPSWELNFYSNRNRPQTSREVRPVSLKDFDKIGKFVLVNRFGLVNCITYFFSFFLNHRVTNAVTHSCNSAAENCAAGNGDYGNTSINLWKGVERCFDLLLLNAKTFLYKKYIYINFSRK